MINSYVIIHLINHVFYYSLGNNATEQINDVFNYSLGNNTIEQIYHVFNFSLGNNAIEQIYHVFNSNTIEHISKLLCFSPCNIKENKFRLNEVN